MTDKLQKHFGNRPIVWVPAWGLSKMRSRGGRYAGAISGEALWYDRWYDRVMSLETAEKLADLGVNLVVLPFSVGGSAEMEKQERDNYERMTGYLHKNEIVSLPYIQFQNILQEEFTLPDVVWAESLDGSRAQYCYWRRTPCQSSPAFRDYFKGLIDDAARRGADGIWIDNNYLKPCRCPLCMEQFRKYLDENCREILDETYLTSFEHIEMPPNLAATDDPIVQALTRFNCARNLEIQTELKSRMEVHLPYGLFASNPALYRGTSYAEKGVDFYPLAQLYDILYLENHLTPHVTGDSVAGNYHGFIALAQCNTLPVPGCWNVGVNPDETPLKSEHGMVETPEEVERVIFEAAAYSASIGMVWAIRSRGHLDCDSPEELLEMYFERPAIFNSMQRALKFVSTIPSQRDRTNAADVAVLHHRESLMLDGARSHSSLHCAEELLLKAGLPYTAVFSEELEDKAERYRVIILPDVTLLSDREADLLRRYVEKGGKLLAIGLAGSRNERRKPRMDMVISDLLGGGMFEKTREIIFNRYGKGTTAFIPGSVLTPVDVPAMFSGSILKVTNWARSPQIVMTAIATLLGNERQIEVKVEGHVAVTLSRTREGRCMAQFFSYDNDPVRQNIRVSLRSDLVSGATARWLTPENKPVELTAETKGGRRDLELPAFRMYGVLVI